MLPARQAAKITKGACPLSSASSPVFGKKYSAFLFDMDGTLLSSIEAAERVWGRWAESHGLDVATFLPTMHGKRGVDTIRQLGLPGVDPEAESAIICQGEIEDVEGVKPLPGAIEFLEEPAVGALGDRNVLAARARQGPHRRRRPAGAALHRHRRGCLARQAEPGMLPARRETCRLRCQRLPGVRGCRGRCHCGRIGGFRRDGHHRHAHTPLRDRASKNPRLYRHRGFGR